MSQKIQRQFGLWESPIAPGMLAGDRRLSDVLWDTDGRTLVWLEGRSDRGVLVASRLDGDAPRDLTSDLSVRAEIGYGGGDFAVSRGAVYFLVHQTGRIHRQPLAGGSARPITPPFGKAAAPAASPDGRWIAYVHQDDDRADRLGIVDSEGTQWPQIFAAGRDFYMQPRWSPDGRRFAWISWDHPRMPWDGTLLCLAEVEYGSGPFPQLKNLRVIAGGSETSIFQPEFTPDGERLLYISDEEGWSQLWKCHIASGRKERLTPGEAEFGAPAWSQGLRTYAIAASGRQAWCACNRQGFVSIVRVNLEDGGLEAMEELAEYTEAAQLAASPAGEKLALLASSPDIPPRLLVYDAASRGVAIAARASGESVPAAALSRPEAVSWRSAGGEPAHGLYYPPASERFDGTGKPPLLAIVHGGPTAQAKAGWNPQGQFFATRGYAVLYVNYRGSTGYGRAYMLRLRGNWGICDVEDAVSGAAWLAEEGRIDSRRTALLGGSAGGFTVLQAMATRPEAFTAGVSLFGISNHFKLAEDTHKFEERYLDSMLGPLPEAAAVYRERSPVFHAHRIRRPLAIFQGDIDLVVPRNQSDLIVEALERSGTPHLYQVYEGEGHGWRKRETIEHFYKAVDEFLRQHLIFS